MEKIIITFALAAAGGFTGYKLGLPAGTLMGAMIAVAVYNIITGNAAIPGHMKIIAQIILGGIIGTGLNLEVFKAFKELLIPVLIFVVMLFVFSLISAVMISRFTGLDIMTSLFSCSPGGLSEMTLIADSYNASVPTVALIHLSRIVSVVLFYPFLAKIFVR